MEGRLPIAVFVAVAWLTVSMVIPAKAETTEEAFLKLAKELPYTEPITVAKVANEMLSRIGFQSQFKDWIHAISFSPDGTRLAAADMAGFVHVWQLDG